MLTMDGRNPVHCSSGERVCLAVEVRLRLGNGERSRPATVLAVGGVPRAVTKPSAANNALISRRLRRRPVVGSLR